MGRRTDECPARREGAGIGACGGQGARAELRQILSVCTKARAHGAMGGSRDRDGLKGDPASRMMSSSQRSGRRSDGRASSQQVHSRRSGRSWATGSRSTPVGRMTTGRRKRFDSRRARIRANAVFGCPRPACEAANAADSVDWLTRLDDGGALVGFGSVDARVTLTMPARPGMRRDHRVCGESSKSQTGWMSP